MKTSTAIGLVLITPVFLLILAALYEYYGLLAALLWLGSVFIGGLIGQQKDQFESGLAWTFLLGPLGVIIVLCLPNHIKALKERDDRRLREEELNVQKQILAELQSRRDAGPEAHRPEACATQPAPKLEVMEDYIPENLQRRRR